MRPCRFLGKLCIGLVQWTGGVEVAWRGGYEEGIFLRTMQSNEWAMNQKMNDADEENAAESAVIQPDEGERMSLSLLRRRIRAGWYEDDVRSPEANHLRFLRWLVREGLLSEWTE
jgi:hypothetical protein